MAGLVILGATGTIGRNTLDVIARQPGRWPLRGVSAHRDDAGLLAICREHAVPLAALADPDAARRLEHAARAEGLRLEVLAGEAGLAELARLPEADTVMAGVVGAAGLLPTLAAARAGKRVLLATKEALVMSGPVFMQAVAEGGATLLPIDSEHNAIFQCLPGASVCGRPPVGVRRVILTASGGPFLNRPVSELASVSPQEAVAHPNWVMGQKISVDSATMMNKGLELIEAARLFALDSARIDVLIHPQSVIHSLVEYDDASFLAQLGSADMRIPIAHALAHPQRTESGAASLDLAEIARLDFAAPDLGRFPCLRLAREALEAGGAAPAVLNAANEVAVAQFLAGGASFTAIARTVEHTLEALAAADLPPTDDLDGVLAADSWARRHAATTLERADA